MPRSTVRVTLADGNHFTTEINLDADMGRVSITRSELRSTWGLRATTYNGSPK